MITKERLEELDSLWGHETENPETTEWRDDLSAEEEQIIAQWDKKMHSGILRLCEDILLREQRMRNQSNPQQSCVEISTNQIRYDSESDSLYIGDCKIHHMDYLDILVPDNNGSGKWFKVQAKLSDDIWLLVDQDKELPISPIGLWGRKL